MRASARGARGALGAMGLSLTAGLLVAGHIDAAAACGSGWGIVTSPNVGTGNNTLRGVDSTSISDVWAVGSSVGGGGADQTLIEHYNGTAWSVTTSANSGTAANDLYAVKAITSSNAWAVGAAGTTAQTLIEHYNGTAWSLSTSANNGTGVNQLFGVDASGASDVWAVGSYVNSSSVTQTLIEHYNGTAWSLSTSPNAGTGTNVLRAVAVVTSADAWAVGYSVNTSNVKQTLTEHWNGTAWSVVTSANAGTGIDNQLEAATVVATGDVWAAGYSGATHQTLTEHWNGTAWAVVTSTNVGAGNNEVEGVAAVSSSNVWAVGSSGSPKQTLTEQDTGSWATVTSPDQNASANELWAASLVPTSADVWAVGDYVNGSVQQTLTMYRCDGTLSVASAVNATVNGAVGAASASGNLSSAQWSDTTGNGSGWNGTIALTLFNYTGSWVNGAGVTDTLSATTSGAYTGSTEGAWYTVTITSASCGNSTSTYTFSVAGDETIASTPLTITTGGSVTANVGTHGVTITWAVQPGHGCNYAVNDNYTIKVGNLAAGAVTLADGNVNATITAQGGTTSAVPTFVNPTATVTGGTVSTAGTAVRFVSAAVNAGMGQYQVVPYATVSYGPGVWAATYTATVQYTIASGP